jgi:chromosome segregation ATPase
VTNSPYPAGEAMLNAHDLANARGVQIEAQAKRIAELEADLVAEGETTERALGAAAKWEEAFNKERAANDSLRSELAGWQESYTRSVADYAALTHEVSEAEAQADTLEDALEQERAAHEATKAELARVTADASAMKARLRNAEAAYQAITEEVRETIDALGVPWCGDLHQCLAWLRDNAFQGKGGAA